MSKGQTKASRVRLEDYLVVDCDVHIMNPEPVQKHKAEYMSEPHRNVMDPEADSVGGRRGRGSLSEIPGEWHGVPLGMEEENGLSDAEEHIRKPLIEEFGVDYPIINMGAGGVNGIPGQEFREEAMRATNNTLLDKFLDDNPDFFGVGTVATSLPDKAAEEIDRLAKEDQIVGLYTATTQCDPPLGDPQYDVMWEAAEEHNLPFVFHSGTSGVHYPNLDKQFDTFLEMHTLGHPMANQIQLVSMVYQGVPVKFPDLDFIFLENGLGWASYLKGRMNREYSERRWDAPLLEKEPGEYIDQSFYFGNQPMEEYDDPTLVTNTIETLGAENVVFATDYPHFDFDHPSTLGNYFRELPEEDVKKIFYENAVDIFNLEAKV